jgi:hypothetical protein
MYVPQTSYISTYSRALRCVSSGAVHHKVGSPRVMAAWFSGYYNGKRDNLIIDMQDFEASLNKVQRFCDVEKNFTVTVLKAVEQVIGTAK